MLAKRLHTTLHRKNYCSILYWYSWDNIAQIRFLCNVVQEASDNIAQEKIVFNVVLILLGQHCTGKKVVQCCPRGFRQHAQEKNLFNVVLILLGQHCTAKIHVQCCPRGFRQHCTGTKSVQCCLSTLGTTLHR